MEVGQKIDHYTLEDKVGDGGFGDVFRAVDDNTGMEVAIKCSRPQERSRIQDFEAPGDCAVIRLWRVAR